MLAGRGITVFVTGLAMWLAARLLGSPGLEVIAIGIAALPLLAAFAAKRGARHDPGSPATLRRPRHARLARDGDTRPREPFADRDVVPPAGGSAPDAARAGSAARDRRDPGRASTSRRRYTLVPQSRGRYLLGPLVVDVSDPFALTRLRLEFPEREELLVTPEIEDLGAAPDPSSGPSFGASRARQLFRTGEEYYTMRQYQEGDDLRRIHWPSVARTGELMIRQDESTPASERARVLRHARRRPRPHAHPGVRARAFRWPLRSACLLARHGFVLRLGTTELPAAALSEERFLDALTGISHAEVRSIGPALAHLRAGSSPDTSLVFVSAPPVPAELGSADPRRRRVRAEARRPDLPDRPGAPPSGATGTARRASQPGPSLPRPCGVGRHRPAPVDEIAGAMAHAAGTSARTHRLIGLVAALLLAAATALAFGRVFLGASTTLKLLGAAIAAAGLAVAFERRSLLLSTVASGDRTRRRRSA